MVAAALLASGERGNVTRQRIRHSSVEASLHSKFDPAEARHSRGSSGSIPDCHPIRHRCQQPKYWGMTRQDLLGTVHHHKKVEKTSKKKPQPPNRQLMLRRMYMYRDFALI
jgi:hypothetical protein